MVRVCKVEIQNFRSIRLLTWLPSPGLNCLIGPGDSGKTTILDAIDLCLGALHHPDRQKYAGWL
nr:ATP-binding protein [Escherichia coli]